MDFRKGRRAYLHTLGCRVNQSESAMLADSLRSAGFEIVDEPESATLIILNSCALTEIAETKTRRALKDFKKKNPETFVCATGCYAQTKAEDLKNAGADCIVSNVEKGALVEILIGEYYKGECGVHRDSFAGELALSENGISPDPGFFAKTQLSERVNLKIQDGCDNACAYCIIPRARGLPRSRKFADIVSDAENLVSRGVREIILTGINISKFDGSISDLCDALTEIKDLKRIAIGSFEPPVSELEKLAVRMADCGHKLSKHFHISLQSASDKVLSAMCRKYSFSEYSDALKRIKAVDADIAVGTDIICGFPGENDDDFLESVANIESCGLSFLHVFTYSERSKTLAALGKAPPFSVRKARADALRKIGAKLQADFISGMRGKRLNVLLENRLKNGEYLGYTENYIQCSVKIPQDGLKNQIACVKILGVDANCRAVSEFCGLQA